MEWDIETDIVVVGAGGCGLTAALSAAEAGHEVVIFEKTKFVLGNTAASAGMIPAAGTRFQAAAGVYDTPEQMAADILRKNGHESDPALTQALCQVSGPLVEWLADSLGMELTLVQEFNYPGHSCHRMHAPRSRAGLDLIRQLRSAAAKLDNLILMLESPVTRLIHDADGRVLGVETNTPNGTERVGARKVILASNGFGGNKDMVKAHIPEMADTLYFGYEANTGEAIVWGAELGAALASMTGYQGHSSVAASLGVLMTWGGVMNGGFLVNERGERFGNEAQGYSEFAIEVKKQPNSIACYIIDEEIRTSLLGIEDFKQIDSMNGLKRGDTAETLASQLGLPAERLARTLEEFQTFAELGRDMFGRTHFPKKLAPPYYGIKVEPALFHTQGGLVINQFGQVLKHSGEPIPNLYAGGGAAVGVSGTKPKGYMSGNGLLAAMGFGRLAGLHAAQSIVKETRKD